jgi:two-component system, OmpR family, response regulator
MDRLRRVVTRGGHPLDLSPREFRLLEYFLLHAEELISRTMLLQQVWNMSFDPETNVVEAHMSNLRRKLEDGGRSRLIQTIRGAGYMLSRGGSAA